MGWEQILLSLEPKQNFEDLKRMLYNEKFTKVSNK